MIAILFENISNFLNEKINYDNINFTDIIMYKIYCKIKEKNENEICMICQNDLNSNKNFDLVICSNKINLSNSKYFLYYLYEEDNALEFLNDNTDNSLLSLTDTPSKKHNPKKYSLSSPLFVENIFDINNEKCFCFMHFDDTSMEYVNLIERYKNFPVVYRYDGNKYKIPDNHGQRFYNFNFLIRNDILSKTKYYIDFRNNIEINMHACEALYHNCVVYLPNNEMNRLSFKHPNIRFMNRKINPETTFCDTAQTCDKITIDLLVKDIINKHMIVKKSKFYI